MSAQILPGREWPSNFLLGVCFESVDSPPDSSKFAITIVGDECQIALGIFAGPKVVNVAACRELYDMRVLDDQLDVLADFLGGQMGDEAKDGLRWTSITGPADLVCPLQELLGRKIGKELFLEAYIRGSYVNKAKFVPSAAPRSDHIIRKANDDDDFGQLSKLLKAFLETPPVLMKVNFEDFLKSVPDDIKRGEYFLYYIPSTKTIASLLRLRRRTPSGVSITTVLTGEEHRRKGYGQALVSWALTPKEEGGMGKKHVTISRDNRGAPGRMYRKLGFVEGYRRAKYDLKE